MKYWNYYNNNIKIKGFTETMAVNIVTTYCIK